jgi:hypothetical protein
MRQTIFIAILSIIFCSCYTERKSEHQLTKAQLTYPELVAKKTSQWYPCGWMVVKMDSMEKRRIEFMYDSLNREIIRITDTIETTLHDTIHITNSQECKQRLEYLQSRLNDANIFIKSLQPKLQSVPIVYRDVLVHDSALIFQMKSDLNSCNIEQKQYHLKYDTWMKTSIWLIVALAFSIIINIIRFK